MAREVKALCKAKVQLSAMPGWAVMRTWIEIKDTLGGDADKGGRSV